jgi:hypothetical protein
MRKPTAGKVEKDTTPDTHQPVTTPSFGETAGQHSFLLQAMFELKGSMSEIKQSVAGLEAKVTTQTAALETIKKTLWFAAGVVSIASILIGIFVEHNYDKVMALLSRPYPAASAKAAAPTVPPPAAPNQKPTP